jgi:hypothetical protein
MDWSGTAGRKLRYEVSEAYFKFVDTDWNMDRIQGELRKPVN